jgi:tetratricopeptide (TPR) repeat protein
VALGALGAWLLLGNDAADPTHGRRSAVNPEAYALFLETRRIGRPPTNQARVAAALALAREVVELDPEFGGGYAAQSFLEWVMVVFGHSKSPAAGKARALELAEKAIRVDPEFSWGYQSLSRARHLVGDLDGAVTAAEFAVDIEPGAAELQGNLGLILTLAGRATEAFEPLRTAIELSGENARHPYRNYLAMAYFHAGRSLESVEAIETNRRLGGPMGPHMHAYLAASYAMSGNMGRAHAAAEQLRSPSFDFPVKGFFENLLRDGQDRQLVFAALQKAGFDSKEL